jgi:hypothetical protein
MEEISLNTTMNFFGAKIAIGPNEMLLILLGFLLLVGIFVVVMVLRKKFG